MNTNVDTDLSSNSDINFPNSLIKTSLIALAVVLSSNVSILADTETENVTTTTRIENYYEATSIPNAETFSNIQKPNYLDRYSEISSSDWFTKAYDDRSLGDILGIE